MIPFAHSVLGCEGIALVHDVAAFLLEALLRVEEKAIGCKSSALCCFDQLAFNLSLVSHATKKTPLPFVEPFWRLTDPFLLPFAPGAFWLILFFNFAIALRASAGA